MILNIRMSNGDNLKYVVATDVIKTISKGDPGVAFYTKSDESGNSVSKERRIFMPFTFIVALEMES
jgi:hypothetical protein